MDKKTVEIFIGPIACNCAGGPAPAVQEKITKAYALKGGLEKMKDRFEVRVYRMDDDSDYDEASRLLTDYLKKTGEGDLMERPGFQIVSATPAVAVDETLVCFTDVPTLEGFLDAIDA